MFSKHKKSKQLTWCGCPGCQRDLCSTDGVTYTDTDLVRYLCICGFKSEWDFDLAPAPVYISGTYLWRRNNDKQES